MQGSKALTALQVAYCYWQTACDSMCYFTLVMHRRVVCSNMLQAWLPVQVFQQAV